MEVIYNLTKLSNVFRSRESTLEWLKKKDLIPRSRYCLEHRKFMKLQEKYAVRSRFICQKYNKYSRSSTACENT